MLETLRRRGVVVLVLGTRCSTFIKGLCNKRSDLSTHLSHVSFLASIRTIGSAGRLKRDRLFIKMFNYLAIGWPTGISLTNQIVRWLPWATAGQIRAAFRQPHLYVRIDSRVQFDGCSLGFDVVLGQFLPNNTSNYYDLPLFTRYCFKLVELLMFAPV